MNKKLIIVCLLSAGSFFGMQAMQNDGDRFCDDIEQARQKIESERENALGFDEFGKPRRRRSRCRAICKESLICFAGLCLYGSIALFVAVGVKFLQFVAKEEGWNK